MSFGNKTALFAFCSFLAFLFFVPPAHSQNTALRISTMPQYPGPHEDVTIVVEDYSRDLNRTEMIWSVNGTIAQKGTGLKRLQTKTGALGSVTNVSISIGGLIEVLAIRPTVTDLLWQADTYTPPFYKGKALHSNQDPLTIVAEPFFINSQGTRLNPDTLVYKWKVDERVDDSASGYGKRKYQYFPSILLKPINISVEVSSNDNLFKSSALVTIPDTRPEALLYENHPLYGILFNNSLNNKQVALADAEISIIGLPYFFSREQLLGNLVTYDWMLNSTSVEKNTNELVFRTPKEGRGSSSVSLNIKNLERYMQAGKGALDITFTSNPIINTNETIF